MVTREQHTIMNSVTDISRRRVATNPEFSMCINGLPNNVCRLAHIVFILICDRIRYSSGLAQKGTDYISNVKPITIDTILNNARSIAYVTKEKASLENDRRNYRKHIVDIHKNNVYYVWKCGKFYIFVMEREIRSWIYYNKEGCVTPHSLLKIISRARGMINCMIGFHNSSNTYMSVSDIESSFGIFINGIIHKMNPLIASEDIPLWEKDKHISEYLHELSVKLSPLETFDGLTEASDYIARLPEYSRTSTMKVRGIEMNAELERDIAPEGDDANLVRKRRAPRKKKDKPPIDRDGSNPSQPKKERYNGKRLNPLDGNASSLSRYYRACIQQLSGRANIRFEDIAIDNTSAVDILDLLKENRLMDREFLDEWIKYFYENSLKGEKVVKSNYNRLSAFRFTFERFKETYHIPQ